MSLRFPHRSTDGHAATPAAGHGSGDEPAAAPVTDSPASCPDRACCCPARPLVKVVIPATATRPAVDLWLCGHHWRTSRAALSGTGAVAYDLTHPQTEPLASHAGVVV